MQRPANLIIFVGESHNRALVAASGHPQIHTPALDSLARRGAQFSNSYCNSPICVPARATIATGLYPHQHKYWENSIALDGRTPTWMKDLRDQGYHVAGIGKFHFRNGDDDNGFSEEILPMHLAEGVGELLGLLRSENAEPIRKGLWDLYTKRCGPGDETSYQAYDKLITQRSIEWMRTHANDEQPWALCIHYVSAHAPYTVPDDLLELYPLDKIELPRTFSKQGRPNHEAIEHLRTILGHEEDIDEDLVKLLTASYFAAITYLDREVGHVLDYLDAAEVTDKTRVVYTADHGYSTGNHFIMGLFNMYEHSLGVPLIMAGPDIPKGKTIRQLTSHVDLFPSIMDSFGVSTRSGLPGTSLWPALQGNEDLDRPVFAEYHALGSKAASYMYREKDQKLVHHVGMPPQLFDLAADPEEERDLGGDPASADVLQRLESGLAAVVSPDTTDAEAKEAQRARIRELGGAEAIIARRGGFIYSPPPGKDWKKF
ncbi:Sulfatase [Cupriavidus taiwanensis]|uniref:Sulfatase n=1 Tax=Cupriavidus taiwanensis TaxID=164546 RepID=A0A375CQX5_9BURK|nr:sulfatase-like hydrolase/transferase [Cupriavidus taiwanensis]SOY77693.1 Sulfatase [Cupriavidus taiwanensis]